MKKTSTVVLLAACLLCSGIAQAQQSFYRGKTVTVISGASGGYDAYAHLLANHMKKYIAGTPTLMAAPDGLTFGGFVRTIPMAPLMGNTKARASSAT
jgi:hypothetical protein